MNHIFGLVVRFLFGRWVKDRPEERVNDTPSDDLQTLIEQIGPRPSFPPDEEVSGPQDGSEMPKGCFTNCYPVRPSVIQADDIKPIRPIESPKFTWLLDNGHGKLTAGKRSPQITWGEFSGQQFLEYEFNREIVVLLKTMLDKAGIKYVDLVPDVDEVGNIVRERVERANQYARRHPNESCVYVSIHSNAAPAPAGTWVRDSIRGIETWFYSKSPIGKAFATVFQQCLVAQLGWRNRNIKSRPHQQFTVLSKTEMPAVLTETGFYNNRLDVEQLMEPRIRRKIARAHFNAIVEIERKYEAAKVTTSEGYRSFAIISDV